MPSTHTNTLTDVDMRGGTWRPQACGSYGFRCGGCTACKLERAETRPTCRYVITYTFVHLSEYGVEAPNNAVQTQLVYGPSLAACKRVFDYRTNRESSIRVLFVESAARSGNTRCVPVDPCSFADTNYRNR